MRPRSLVLPAAVSVLLAALVALAAAPARLVNYDTEYALVWGNDLVHGRTPDYTVPFAPTPHPLATLVGAIGALFGTGFGETLFELLAFLSLGVLGWLVFALGRAWFTTATGVVAALLVLTREPILSYGVRAYVDIPYICLLLGALLVETRRRRAGTPVLVLIALAGLLRPEAWLFAGAYALWLWRGGALRPVHVALVVGSPLLWALSDLAVTGDPLHSLTGTRSTAEDLGRVTGLRHVPTTLPRRLGEILREPVLFGAAVGGALALWRLRSRAALGAVSGVLAVGAFCVLAAAGLSILTRYLLLPATLLAIFAAAAVCGWTLLPREDPWRLRWAALGAVTAIGIVAFVPSQLDRLRNTRSALVTQTRILDELHDIADRYPLADCRPVTVPNRRAVPQISLWSGLPPRDIRSAQELGRWQGTSLVPVSRAVAGEFVLDARDKDRALPPAPPTPVRDEVGRFWAVYGACGK